MCRRVETSATGAYDPVVILPFLVFWIFVFLCRKELGWRWTLGVIGIWCGLLLAFIYAGVWPYYFVAAQALLDAILLVVFLKGDVPIRYRRRTRRGAHRPRRGLVETAAVRLAATV